MSILTAIFQAIGQALTWILPVSESGHSAIFHNFSGRFTNACSQLTGVIHIGIAIGLFIAFFKLFKTLFLNFIGTWIDIFGKKLDLKNPTPARRFMYMTILSFAFMLFYFIPAGKYGNVFSLFHRFSYNTSLLEEGICMLMTGVLLFVAFNDASKKLNPLPYAVQAVIIGVAAFLALPTAGCSFIGAVLAIGILVGMREKQSLRYGVVMSVIVLIVSGIIELCVAVTQISIVSALIALVVSAAAAFFVSKLLITLIKKMQMQYIAIYDAAIGIICFVIGIFQVLIK